MIPDSLKDLPLAASLENRFPEAVAGGSHERGELTLYVKAGDIVDVCRHLKEELTFNRLASVTAVDWFPREPRFEVVYHLHSLARNERLRLKCQVTEESCEIASVCPVWRGADWYEREVFDLFGIRFSGHPDLRRIMMPDDWEGHPLRKDYPVHGHRYSYAEE
jgi:NADH-quinone oxidoreductase subunit C